MELRHRKTVELLHFDGKTPLEPYLVQVKVAMLHNGWDQNKALVHVFMALEDKALQVLVDDHSASVRSQAADSGIAAKSQWNHREIGLVKEPGECWQEICRAVHSELIHISCQWCRRSLGFMFSLGHLHQSGCSSIFGFGAWWSSRPHLETRSSIF